MCNRPKVNAEGKPFACRECDACVRNRLNHWTAKACAEAAMWPFTMSLTLTYGSATQEQRDGAAVFRYSDIRRFLDNLRRQIAYHLGRTGSVRYIACGEQGDRFGRCHWHLVLYTDVDLLSLGEWTLQGRPVSRDDIVTEAGSPPKRRGWSLWPHGFVVVQEPDESGLRYALQYALKDQFSLARSTGSGRYTKAENHAAGFFRMSKRPPIGRSWLDHSLARLSAQNSVAPGLVLRVPEYSYLWVLRGDERRYYLRGLVAINDRVRSETGRDAPQWSSLVAACRDNLADMEIINGETDPQEDTTNPDYRSIEADVSLRQREASRAYAAREIARSCGGPLPCKACLRGFAEEAREALGVRYSVAEDGRESWSLQSGEDFDTVAARRLGRFHPLCQLRDSPDYLAIFPRSSP